MVSRTARVNQPPSLTDIVTDSSCWPSWATTTRVCGAAAWSTVIETLPAAFEMDGDGGWRFRTLAGAGIVADSDPAAELAETDAKIAAIRQALLDLAARGAAVVVISQDLDELLELSDRFAALNEGRLSAPVPTEGLTLDQIGLMLGGAHGLEVAHVAA